MCVRRHMCLHMRNHKRTSYIYFLLCWLSQKLDILPGLVNLWDLPLCSPVLGLQAGGHTWLFPAFSGICTGILMLAQQVLLPSKPSLQPHTLSFLFLVATSSQVRPYCLLFFYLVMHLILLKSHVISCHFLSFPFPCSAQCSIELLIERRYQALCGWRVLCFSSQ